MSEMDIPGIEPIGYAELFEVTAATHELDASTNRLKFRSDVEGVSSTYSKVVEGKLPLAYGYDRESLRELVEVVDHDVADMFKALGDLSIENL